MEAKNSKDSKMIIQLKSRHRSSTRECKGSSTTQEVSMRAVKYFFRALKKRTFHNPSLQIFVKIKSNRWDPKHYQHQVSQYTCESKTNPGEQQWKNSLFVVGKVHRQYEDQYQIFGQISKHGGWSYWHNSTKWSWPSYTEVWGSQLPVWIICECTAQIVQRHIRRFGKRRLLQNNYK